MSENEHREEWHVDRSIPLAVLWSILVQAALVIVIGTLMYADIRTQRKELAQISDNFQRELARLNSVVDREISRLEAQQDQTAAIVHQQAIQFGRVEESLASVRNHVADIKSDMRRILQIWEPTP